MKKIFVLSAALVFVASNCFALDSGATGTMTLTDDVGLELHADADTATADTALIGKLSTGVGVGWKTETGGYALVTQHKNGTKAYGTSYDSTAIYQYKGEVSPGSPALAVPTATDTSDFTSDFKPM